MTRRAPRRRSRERHAARGRRASGDRGFRAGTLRGADPRSRGGSLSVPGARGGPARSAPALLHRHQRSARDAPVDARRMRAFGWLDPRVFTLFGRGPPIARRNGRRLRAAKRLSTRDNSSSRRPGLNGGPRDPVAGAYQDGTCTICHDTPNAGNHSVAMALNIGIAEPFAAHPRPAAVYPRRHRTTGEVVQTTDPGRAMVTGRWNDIGKFKGPVLRALAARARSFTMARRPPSRMSSRSTRRAFGLGSPIERRPICWRSSIRSRNSPAARMIAKPVRPASLPPARDRAAMARSPRRRPSGR